MALWAWMALAHLQWGRGWPPTLRSVEGAGRYSWQQSPEGGREGEERTRFTCLLDGEERTPASRNTSACRPAPAHPAPTLPRDVPAAWARAALGLSQSVAGARRKSGPGKAHRMEEHPDTLP